MTALVCILMGIPTTARYITMVTVAARCMVKKSIRANFQKNTGVLAAPAKPRPIGKTKT